MVLRLPLAPVGLKVALGVALGFLLAFVFFPRTAAAQLLSPGPLTRAHASLEGDQHCSACHSQGKRVEAGGCLKCHQDLGARLDAGKGLHGIQYRGKPCEGCHVEHLGRDSKLVRWPGGDPSKLDHAQTGWPLRNAHTKVACAKCHTKSNARGAHTYLGLSSACASCHKDPHENRFGLTCTNCHDDVSWKRVKLDAFDHDLARFALRGAHQKVACAKCHHEPPKWVGIAFGNCTDCHKDPHAGKLGPTCTGCHDEARWRPARFKAGGHPGVSLANGHASVACRTCHDKGNLVAPSRGRECASCHKPVHKAPFGRGCASCHGSIQWLGLPRSIGLSAHSRTAFSLTGKHEATSCAGCHRPALPRDQRYRRLAFGRCIDCHEDKHRGEFAKAQAGECKPCHTTDGFRPTLFGIPAHAQTKFPLVGKHAAAACSACHTAPKPRLDLRVSKQACADCHANPHGDQFAAEMRQGGCAHCHDPRGWDSPKIDHSTWPLTGAHATTRCERCHTPSDEDRKTGKGASYRGVPRSCAGCHDDLHAGQFRTSEPVVGECDRCHETASFEITQFDHAARARYPLTGGHTKLTCDRCHPMTKLKDGNQTIRWRLPSSECRYCHADPHAEAAR